MQLGRKFLLIFTSLLIGLFILEAGIRSYDAVRGFGFFSDRRNQLTSMPKLRPFRTFGPDLYRDRDGKRLISSRHGELFSFEKSDGTVRIVVFGGSTTENFHAFKIAGIHYPAVMQKRLRKALGRPSIEVINVANSSYATPHSLILLALDVISWNPDLIIISHNVNDLLVLYWPNFALDYSNKYKHIFYSMPDFENLYTPLNILFQKSQLYWVVRDRLERLFQQPRAELRRQSYGKMPPSEALETFKRNLRSIIAIAKYNDIEVLLGTQPLMQDEEFFISHMKEKPYNNIVIYPLHEEFISHHNIFNDALVEVATEYDVYYVDNRPSMSGNEKYFKDFVHYTPDGIVQLAENYVNFLLDNKMLTFEPLKP